jgi:hypothetical protein
MRRTIIVLLAFAPAWAWGTEDAPAGRWEGLANIPGRALPLVMDLARQGAGQWTGSLIVPGLGIKGASLSNIVVAGAEVAFDVDNALAGPPSGSAAFRARMTADGRMEGEMRQAGNVASFSLAKVGPAQVELPPRSTPVSRELAAQWKGEYELGGYPRLVTITLEQHDGAGATARFAIVGKRATEIPVDLVIQDGDFLRIESQVNQVAFEGRIAKEGGQITGTLEMGPLELPLVLRRAVGSPS